MGTCLKDSSKLNLTKTMFIDQYTKGLNSEGVATKGNSGWGALRYPANFAFLAACWSQAQKTAILDTFIFKQVDYILGANNAKQSFIVGFCSGCSKQPEHPHHRNVYLRDDNPPDSTQQSMEIPERNKIFGYMVGGSWNSADYKDNVRQYAFTEGGLDYNAGLVGALGYIVSKLDPADTNSFVGVSPGNRSSSSRAGPFFTMRPSNGELLFCSLGKSRIANLSIYDQLGKKIHQQSTLASTMRWKPTKAGPCLVYVRALLANGSIVVRPFCLMR
jgi:hypothetical protein